MMPGYMNPGYGNFFGPWLYAIPVPSKHSSADRSRLAALRARIAKAPLEPGVYKWLDDAGAVLYVGKAKNLRNRLRSYVAPGADHGVWKENMMRSAADFAVTVVESELEALLLETNIIKELRPKYNVMMKDDKNYLFIRVSREPYPRVETVRRMGKDDAQYFGPYLSSDEAHRILELLQETIGYRACRESLDALNRGSVPPRPCLESQIGLCCGLCAGTIDRAEYCARIDRVIAFLKGRTEDVERILKERMQAAAMDRKFERAAKLRDQLRHFDHTAQPQVATAPNSDDSDIFGVAVLSGRASVVLLHQRQGRITGEAHFSLRGQAESVASVLEQFLPQYYEEGREIPPVVLLCEDIEERVAMEEFLRLRRGGAVHLLTPERGTKSRLVQLAEKNARERARQEELKWEAEQRNTVDALASLQALLQLPAPPRRIEGYDISHLGGTATVGSMVVTVSGKAANDQYRSFTIHSMQHGAIDDYRAIKETLARRLRHVSGGLRRESGEWAEAGITVGKARKDEAKTIAEIVARYPEECPQSDVDYKTFLIARCDEEIVGFVRLVRHPGKLLELNSLWVADAYQSGKLGQFLVRSLLASLKKEKVYVRVVPELEASYASLGFRHVLKAPTALLTAIHGATGDKRLAISDKHENTSLTAHRSPLIASLVMMYDPVQHKTDASLAQMPDLLVIDGGKGQLSAAVEVLREAAMSIPVIGLAKREEEIFIPPFAPEGASGGRPGLWNPLVIPKDSPALFLLMRLRDEAHRFANKLRETKGSKSMKQSVLDTIPGIGPETRAKLLKKFKTIDGIRRAPEQELREVLSEEQMEVIQRML